MTKRLTPDGAVPGDKRDRDARWSNWVEFLKEELSAADPDNDQDWRWVRFSIGACREALAGSVHEDRP